MICLPVDGKTVFPGMISDSCFDSYSNEFKMMAVENTKTMLPVFNDLSAAYTYMFPWMVCQLLLALIFLILLQCNGFSMIQHDDKIHDYIIKLIALPVFEDVRAPILTHNITCA